MPRAGLNQMNPTDAELVGRVLSGDLQSYGELIARHRPRLERYAYYYLGTREDAEEALQDSLIRAYRAVAQCANPDRFGAWILRILVNRCRSRRVRRRLPLWSLDGLAPAQHPTVAHSSERAEWREEIRQALAELSAEQRESFLLKHVEDMTYDEMAHLTGATVPALKMRVSRACERLRARLAEVYRAG